MPPRGLVLQHSPACSTVPQLERQRSLAQHRGLTYQRLMARLA